MQRALLSHVPRDPQAQPKARRRTASSSAGYQRAASSTKLTNRCVPPPSRSNVLPLGVEKPWLSTAPHVNQPNGVGAQIGFSSAASQRAQKQQPIKDAGARKRSTHRNQTALHQIQEPLSSAEVLGGLGIEKGNQWDRGEESPAPVVIAKETTTVSEDTREEEEGRTPGLH